MTEPVPVEPVAGEVVVWAETPEDAAVRAWLDSLTNTNTYRSFEYAMKLWRAFLADQGRALIDPTPDPRYNHGPRRVELDRFRNQLVDQGKAPKTVDSRMIAVRRFYEHLIDEGAISVNPVSSSRLLNKGRRKPTHALDEDEMLRLKEAAKKLDPARRLLVLFQATSGCRVDEALRLKVGDLAHASGMAVVTITRKGGERQTITIDPVVHERIAAHVTGWPKDAHVFTKADGTPLTYSGARFTVDWLGRKAGLVDQDGKSRVTPHVLRASVITILLDMGKPIEVVQQWVGHKQMDTTGMYYQGKGMLRRQLDLASAMGGVLGLEPNPATES